MKVLIAEDDEHILQGLAEILQREGYATCLARNGVEALRLQQAESPDFVCLDIMMPEMDGYEVCRRLRARDARLPIIFLSAKSEEIDRVLGLELGADDFIMKPFGVKEVVARIRAVTRRCLASPACGSGERPFAIGDLEVSPAELRARRGPESIDLSLRDVQLLHLFASHPGVVLDRDTIFDRVWGTSYLPSSRTLDQHISQLRKRIERDPKQPRIIETVHGVGYRYDPARNASPQA